jgi:hypothetical protein
MMQAINKFSRRLDAWSIAYPYRTAIAMGVLAVLIAVVANCLHVPVFFMGSST